MGKARYFKLVAQIATDEYYHMHEIIAPKDCVRGHVTFFSFGK